MKRAFLPVALLVAIAASGCDRALEAQPAAPAAERAASPAADPAAPAAPVQAPAAGCAGPLAVELDRASFARQGEDAPFADDRLEALREAAGAAFRAAADAACVAGQVDPARLAGLRRLVVQSASGATETAVYQDAESFGADALIFQWIFVEADLAVPDAADIGEGLACWAEPDRPVCAERMP